MENQNPSREPQQDDILEQIPENKEIQTDPSVDSDTILIHPKDLEFEKVMNEYKQEAFPVEPEMPLDFGDTPAEEPPMPVKKETKKKSKKKEEKELKGFRGFLVKIGLGQFVATLIWMGLILLIGVSLGRTLWAATSDVMAFGKEEVTATVTIEKNEVGDTAKISQKLRDAGLIRYPKLFKMFVELTDKDSRISAGTFELNSMLDYNAMVNAMSGNSSAREEVEIMFPEGYTCFQMFELLEEKGVCTANELKEYAANGELKDYWFLEGVQRGTPNCLEGYLFPDTYEFYLKDDPRRVIEKFLDDFDYRFTDLMKEEFVEMQGRYAKMLANRGYDQEYINNNPLTLHKVVIIASLIEKETSGVSESYDISSVIYNRLTNQRNYPYLNIDAALVYALGGKTELTEEDKLLDSPYNTYKYTGLVPGPISNPGRDSIFAALDPNDTNYYFYALDPSTGSHHFTSNYNDHLAFLDRIG